MNDTSISSMKAFVVGLQKELFQQWQERDRTLSFLNDEWSRPEGGGGCTGILKEGEHLEQGAVNVSHIYGEHLPPAATLQRPELANQPFVAIGISIIFHPRNPFAPTTHANWRYFSTTQREEPIWWFGGGFDLTPFYPFLTDCQTWHHAAKTACDPFGTHLYPTFKKQCDEYFYLPHRQETRGVGGLFFDDFQELDFDTGLSMLNAMAEAFTQAYFKIIDKRMHTPYTAHEKDFQTYRRGRYVEFNLLYDRGTLFGLQSNGRVESILASLPPQVSWRYNWHPEPQSPEATLYTDFLKPRDWLNLQEMA